MFYKLIIISYYYIVTAFNIFALYLIKEKEENLSMLSLNNKIFV